MVTVYYECGCAIIYDMFNEGKILNAFYCSKHNEAYYSRAKTLTEMVQEVKWLSNEDNDELWQTYRTGQS